MIQQQLKIVLVRPSHPGNIGAAARAMKTMGLQKLHLVRPRLFPDHEAIVRAAGADDLLQQAQVHDDLAAAVADCKLVLACSARQRHIKWQMHSPEDAAKEIITNINNANNHQSLSDENSSKVAILFGHEQSGLTNAELSHCNAQIVIPSVEDYSSLNLAAAVQVICYALRAAVLAAEKLSGLGADLNEIDYKHEDDMPATMQQLQGLYDHLEQQMVAVGFLDRRKPKLLMRRIQRFFQSRTVTQKEINIFRGFLSTVERAIDQNNKNTDNKSIVD
jgi:tRNA (cytidine32/uridine32-2'-O)-methyltransferase